MNKRFILFGTVLLLGISFFLAWWHQWSCPIAWYVDFDQSLQTSKYPAVLHSGWAQRLYPFFKAQYEKNSLKLVTYQAMPKIPKIIHQIWLGSPFPEKYRVLAASWKKYHPDWEYVLWTDETIATFGLKNEELYNKAVNYGERSDIARYEILARFGGLYVDTDFECFRPFDLFHHCYDFYIGIQPLDTNILQLGIGIIGAAPGHPFLQVLIDGLPKNSVTPQIVAKTGPIYCTRMFYSHIQKLPGTNVALPPTYFYPLGYTQDLSTPDEWRRSESFAVHHWHGSWLKREAFISSKKIARRAEV